MTVFHFVFSHPERFLLPPCIVGVSGFTQWINSEESLRGLTQRNHSERSLGRVTQRTHSEESLRRVTQRNHLRESLRGFIERNRWAEPLGEIAQSRWIPPPTSEAEQSTLNNLRRDLLKIHKHNKRAALTEEPRGRHQYYYILDQERRASSPEARLREDSRSLSGPKRTARRSRRCTLALLRHPSQRLLIKDNIS